MSKGSSLKSMYSASDFSRICQSIISSVSDRPNVTGRAKLYSELLSMLSSSDDQPQSAKYDCLGSIFRALSVDIADVRVHRIEAVLALDLLSWLCSGEVWPAAGMNAEEAINRCDCDFSSLIGNVCSCLELDAVDVTVSALFFFGGQEMPFLLDYVTPECTQKISHLFHSHSGETIALYALKALNKLGEQRAGMLSNVDFQLPLLVQCVISEDTRFNQDGLELLKLLAVRRRASFEAEEVNRETLRLSEYLQLSSS